MEEKEPIRIRLSTVILSIIILVLIGGIVYLALINSKLRSEQQSSLAETQNSQQNEYTKILTLEENEELKEFLSYVGDLNTYKDNNYVQEGISEDGFYTGEKIMIASMFTKLERKDDYVTYNLSEIKEAIKEIFNEDINVEEVLKSEDGTIFYNSEIGAYIDGGGDGSYSVYLVKIESQQNLDGIHEVTFIYGYPSEGDFINGTEGECDCYRTTVKIKVNEDYKYSKYQFVSSKLEGTKVGKIKDFDSSTSKTTDQYTEITKELDGEDVLEVTEMIANNNGTYTLKGRISAVDTSKEQIAEFPFRKYTDYKQITVSTDTKFTYIDYNEEEGEVTKTSTVADGIYNEKNIGIGNTFNFKFKNGKCVEVYEVIVGH